jgi:hypothetical protein
MTITAEELAKLDKAATQGEWQWTILDHSMACLGVGDCPGHGTPLVMGVSPCRSCADRIEGENGEWTWGKCLTPSLADAAFIPATVNAYRSRHLVHVDEVEKLRAALRALIPIAALTLQDDDALEMQTARAALGDSQ